MKRYLMTALSVVSLCAWLALSGYAQTGTSRVTGIVQDKAGAVIAGANITLTNEGTNVSFTATSTSAGTYSFDSVQLGSYTITAEMSGFKKFISKGNILTVGVPLTVTINLEVGQTQETVEVTASFERVQTSTSGNFGATVDNKTLTDLPLGLESATGGRNPLIFVRLQPGVVVGANTGGGSHVNGARDRAFNYTLDGIDINESSAGGSEFSPLRTNPDSIQEFRVITSNATAEHGRNSGAQVALVTKSGTNQFHGNLFYFNRNSAMSANEWENNLNGVKKPFLLQHQYGGDVGGPLSIPKIYNGKDRTFFFFNFQGQRQVSPFTLTRTVYTTSVKQGLFRYVVGGRNTPFGATGASVDAAGTPVLPNCSATVTTNCIATYDVFANDPRRLGVDPTIKSRVLDLLPTPNSFATGDGLNTAGYIFNGGRLDPQKDFVFKIDHRFNDSNSVSVRYGWGSQNTINDTTNSGAPAFPGLPPKVNTTRDPKNMAATYRRVITPNLVNELVGGFNHFTFNFINPSAGAQPYTIVTVNPTDPLDFTTGNLRTINTVQLVDNLSYTRGAHLMKAGINFRYQQHKDLRGSIGGQNAGPIVNILGTQTVNTACLTGSFGAGGTTGVNTSGQELFCLPSTTAGPLIINSTDRTRMQSTIDDLLGRVFSVTQGFAANSDLFGFQPAGSLFVNDARYPEYDFYFHDTWKVRPNLTIDLGLRYETKLTPRARGRLFTPNSPVTVGGPPSSTLRWTDHELYRSDLNNLGPSIGFAWDPWGKGRTSIRANYRIAYDRLNTQVVSSQIYNTIPGITLGVVNTAFGQNGGPSGTSGRIRDGIPSVVPPASVRPIDQTQPAAFGSGSITVIDPDFRAPKTNMWELDLQHEVGKGIVVDIAYLGRAANGLFGAYNVNQVDIFRNGFLAGYNTVVAGGDSTLINQIFGPDTRRNTGETVSAFVRRQFASQIALNSVAAVAADAAGRIQSGVPMLQQAGLPLTFFRPFPQFATINVIDANDYSTYHALQVLVQRKFSKGLQFQGAYTFSKSLDTRSFDPAFTVAATGNGQSASSTPFDINRRYLNYARSDFDRKHIFVGYATWDLPFGSGQHFGGSVTGFARHFIEGWNVNGVMTIQSGRPFTIYSGANQLTNVVNSTVNCNGCSRSMGQVDERASNFGGVPGYFTAEELARFSQPVPGDLGNTGRNYFTGPGRFSLDAAILKRTYFGNERRANFELRFEFFNVLNHAVFNFPTAVFTSTTFGRIRDSLVSESRKIRIGAKINF